MICHGPPLSLVCVALRCLQRLLPMGCLHRVWVFYIGHILPVQSAAMPIDATLALPQFNTSLFVACDADLFDIEVIVLEGSARAWLDMLPL